MKTINIKLPAWNITELTGYEPVTTFWNDFSIADSFGADAVRDTYRRAFDEWKDDCAYLTELVMVLNHKCWLHHDCGDEDMSMLYESLYVETARYAEDNLKGDDLSYYLQTTD